jgi:transposase
MGFSGAWDLYNTHMKKPRQLPGKARFTREALGRLSKDDLIELLLWQQEQIAALTARVEELERQLGMNSHNSSRPPSSDGPEVARPERKPKSSRRPGGQPGHEGHKRELLPVSEVDEVIPVKPEKCKDCGRRLRGCDASPRRRQVWDLPVIKPVVTEYQLHSLSCKGCGKVTAAEIPEGVTKSSFGSGVLAVVAILTGVLHASKRAAEMMMNEVFNVPMSLGVVCACEATVSRALEARVAEAHEYVQRQDVLYADETGWRENRKKAWLWVAAAGLVTVFKVFGSRSQEAAKALLGFFSGILVSDRFGAYNFYEGKRQVCWAHLLRAFTAFSELAGKAARIGRELADEVEEMFKWWHRVRDGTMTRKTFQRRMGPLRLRVEALLESGTVCGHAKTEGTCKKILKLRHALWTFVHEENVEPTNNAAERAIRPAVLWRKGSFGTHSAAGSRFVERVMTAAATCKQQGRSIVDYLTAVCRAHLHDRPAPSLLPTPETVSIAA